MVLLISVLGAAGCCLLLGGELFAYWYANKILREVRQSKN